MNRFIAGASLALLVVAGAGCASRALSFSPVREERPSHLGIALAAPGTQNWYVTEKRYDAGWRIMYKYEDSANLERTRIVFLKADRYEPGGFARAHQSLRDLADKVLQESRQDSNNRRFREKRAEVVRSDLDGREAYRIRIAWEEWDNPTLPGKTLLMQNEQVLLLHPRNPDEIISILVSTRHQVGKEALSPEEMATPLLASLKFE